MPYGYRIMKIAARIVAINAFESYADHMAAPKLRRGAGSNGLPPMKGVGASSCELELSGGAVCTGSLVTVDCAVVCAVVCTDVASVEELVDVSESSLVVDGDGLSVVDCIVVEASLVDASLVGVVSGDVVVAASVVVSTGVVVGIVENPFVVPGCTVVVTVVA